MKIFLRLCIVCSLLTGCIDLAVNDTKSKRLKLFHANPTYHYPNVQIYTMRGGLGGVFSKGMNRLENALENHHIPASSTVWYKGSGLSKVIIRNYQMQPSHRPIILVGHSLGANEQINVAKALNKANIPVALLITVDPVIPARVSPNVHHAINFYKSSFVPMLSGMKISAESAQLTLLENRNVKALGNIHVNHFTIDSNPIIQQQMLDEIIETLHTDKDPKVPHDKHG